MTLLVARRRGETSCFYCFEAVYQEEKSFARGDFLKSSMKG